MQKSKRKKIISIMLALMMTAGVLTGCSSGKTVSSSGTVSSNGEDSNINMKSLAPVVNKQVTMSIAITVSSQNEDPTKSWFFTTFEKETNVHWNIIAIPDSSWDEKKAVMMQTDDYPDVFFGQSFTAAEIEKYGTAGIFIPLNNYINKYGDKIKEKMAMVKTSTKNVTCTDGNIYGLPVLTLLSPYTNGRYWINLKWCDEVGVKRPTTTDEFYTVLKAFKEKDPAGKGKTIPFSGTLSNVRALMLNAFGFVTDGDTDDNVALDRNKDIVYMPLQQGYKNYLTFMHKLYAEGLLDQDFLTQDDTQFKAKSSANLVGAYGYAAPFLADLSHYKDYEAIALTDTEGTTPVVYTSPYTTIGKFEVTKKCKTPAVAVRWANMFYDPKYSMEISAGPEYGSSDDPDKIGYKVDYDSNGNYTGYEWPAWNKVSDKIGAWDWISEQVPRNSNWPFGIDEDYVLSQLFKGVPKNAAELKTYYQAKKDDSSTKDAVLQEAYWRVSNLTYSAPYAQELKPAIYFTEDNEANIEEWKTPLEDYVKEAEAKFITGRLSVDKDWDSFQQQLEQLHAKDYQQLYIDAYSK